MPITVSFDVTNILIMVSMNVMKTLTTVSMDIPNIPITV